MTCQELAQCLGSIPDSTREKGEGERVIKEGVKEEGENSHFQNSVGLMSIQTPSFPPWSGWLGRLFGMQKQTGVTVSLSHPGSSELHCLTWLSRAQVTTEHLTHGNSKMYQMYNFIGLAPHTHKMM